MEEKESPLRDLKTYPWRTKRCLISVNILKTGISPNVMLVGFLFFFTLSKPKPNQKKCNVCKSGNAVALIIMFGCKMFKVSVEIFLPNITGEMALLKILLRTYTQY